MGELSSWPKGLYDGQQRLFSKLIKARKLKNI